MAGACIAHIDLDAFYVSVELLRRPELRGLPVVVAGGGPRSVVTTASYEARQYGIFSATPAARARRLCPEAVFVPPDFATYRAHSQKVMAVLRREVERVQVVGLDEAYLDLSDLARPKTAARRIKSQVREETGLSCSIGVGPNKLVAKVASDAEKPDGFVALTREEAMERFAGASPQLIPGIGPKTAARLRGYGVTTLGQLSRCTVGGLIERFGESHGRALHDRAHFRGSTSVGDRGAAKSRSVESTFDRDISDLARLEEIVTRQAERLSADLRAKGVAGRTLGIKVRLDDWTTVTRVHTIERPTDDATVIAATARDLLRAYAPPRPVRLLGVRVAGFETPANPRGVGGAPPGDSLSLLAEPTSPDAAR